MVHDILVSAEPAQTVRCTCCWMVARNLGHVRAAAILSAVGQRSTFKEQTPPSSVPIAARKALCD